MCLIVDVNVFHFFKQENHAEYGRIRKELFYGKKKKLRLVYGGGLRREYLKDGAIRKIVANLDRAGRTEFVKDAQVDSLVALLKKSPICKSNDWAIIALAQLSSGRLLCSNDGKLKIDFTNMKLVSNPKGRIYNVRNHDYLMRSL
jgi:hypothetical protein